MNLRIQLVTVITLIGAGVAILPAQPVQPAQFFQGNLHTRTLNSVIESNGKQAWIQPVAVGVSAPK